MPLLRKFLGGLRALARRREDDREVDEELRGYVDAAAGAKMRAGMNPEEALRAARVEMGSAEAVKESVRGVGWEIKLETLWRDAAYGARMLRRNPGFAAAAILTLALGIGANTAIFSVVDALMLRPLPYPQPERMVHLSWKFPDAISPNLTVPQYKFWRDNSDAFEALAGIRGESEMELREAAGSEWVKGLKVTDGFFRVMGMSPTIGRGFSRAETEPGAAPSAVLTNHLWRTAFHGDPNVVGRQILLDAKSYIVVGVLPPNFTFSDPPNYPDPPDMLLALEMGHSLGDRGVNTEVMGRLRDGVSLTQAKAEMPLLTERFRAQSAATERMQGEMELESLQSYQASGHRAILLLLLGAVALLLLIACANVASLLLARATARQRETAIRLALGAARRRLLAQFLAEGSLLGLAGAAAGLMMAVLALDASVAAIPWQLPATASARLDWRVLAFTLTIGIGASVVFGLASYTKTRGIEWSKTLKEGRTLAGLGRGSGRVLKALVIGEVAIALMLALGAGLLLESLYRLYEQNLGFDSARIVTIETAPLPGRVNSVAALVGSERQALERLRAIPGVESAAMISDPPLNGQDNFPCQREGHPEDSFGGMEFRMASPEYFSTMRIPVLRGRGLLATDTAASAPVAVIDETLARRWWPGGNPLGDHVVLGEFRGRTYFRTPFPAVEIVGVVADTRMSVEQEARPMIYVPVAYNETGFFGNGEMYWVARTRAGASVGTEMRAAFAAAAPDLRVVSMRSMAQMIGADVAQPRFNALLLGAFGGLALALTLVGIYGVLGFQLSQRTHEIGVRVALGAKPGDVVRLVVGQAVTLAAVGVALGIGGGLAASHLLASLLYEVKPMAAEIYVGAAALLMLVAVAASYLPARRAMRVDPMTVLRNE